MKGSAEEAQALRHGLAAHDLARDFLRATGPDAVSFLQGQLSQDVAALAVGDAAFSLVLQPQGKVDALLRVTRVDDDELVLDTEAGWGDVLAERLERFKLRVRCTIEPLAWLCLAVRGAEVPAPALGSGTWAVLPETPGLAGYDLLGPDPACPAGALVVGHDAYEALRIEAGVPRMGAELDATTIPAATGVVDRTTSFTKGCYTGQELVARIDSRGGKVPRRLCGVVVAGDVTPPVGATVEVAGREVGSLTSVGESWERRAPVALAYIRRDVEVPAEAHLRWDGGESAAQVEALPLVP